MFTGMIFCIYGVKEGPRPLPPTATKEVEQPPQEKKMEELVSADKGLWWLLVDFFNFKELGTILKVFTRKRTEKKRMMLFLCYMLLFFGFGPMFGK